MAKPVLFVSVLGKSLERCENLKAIYDAYKGEKYFISTHDSRYRDEVDSGKYDLMVIDAFPTITPGKTIMIWHAIQGAKFVGLNETGTYYRADMADMIDRIVVAGHGAIDMFHQSTRVPKDRMLNLGMPRTDRYKGKKKGDGNTIMSYMKGYLFAPTWRSWREPAIPNIDWGKIDRALGDDEIMVVKSHPYGNDFRIHADHIVVADKMKPSVNYLYDADVVITDYSSIMFDAYLLNKPVVLFEKNQEYTKSRGMYMNYPDDYCSRYARTEDELIQLMKSAKRLRKADKACRDFVADACDGHSCERICKLIEEMNGGE